MRVFAASVLLFTKTVETTFTKTTLDSRKKKKKKILMSRSSRLSPSRDYIQTIYDDIWTNAEACLFGERVRGFAKLDSSRPLFFCRGKRKHCVPDESNPQLSRSREREREMLHTRFDVPQNVTRGGVEQCCVLLADLVRGWFCWRTTKKDDDDDDVYTREKEERTSRSSEVFWVFRQLLLLSRISSIYIDPEVRV